MLFLADPLLVDLNTPEVTGGDFNTSFPLSGSFSSLQFGTLYNSHFYVPVSGRFR